jgi:hypothetical protein
VKLIRTEYDAYNRRFKLLNTSDAHQLRDGDTYMFMDFSDDDMKQDEFADCGERPEIHPAEPVSQPR